MEGGRAVGQHAGGPVSLEMSHRLPLLCAPNGACMHNVAGTLVRGSGVKSSL